MQSLYDPASTACPESHVKENVLINLRRKKHNMPTKLDGMLTSHSVKNPTYLYIWEPAFFKNDQTFIEACLNDDV